MSQAQKPVVQGVVSELATPREDIDTEERNNLPPDDQPGGGDDEDLFGEKFEIPAFLRKIH
jgi:hypothetical protein